MPIYEFLCGNGHKTEMLFRTREEIVEQIECPKCGKEAGMQFPLPFPGHFHGEGFYKPSPASPKVVNPDTCSFEGDGYVKAP